MSNRLEEIINKKIENIDFSKHVMGEEPLQDNEFTDLEDVMLGFRNSRLSLSFIIQFNNDVRIEYAKECSQASLEKASEKACIEPKGMMTRVDKTSITNQDNIILL